MFPLTLSLVLQLILTYPECAADISGTDPVKGSCLCLYGDNVPITRQGQASFHIHHKKLKYITISQPS